MNKLNLQTYTIYVTGFLAPKLNIRKGKYNPKDQYLVSCKIVQSLPNNINELAKTLFDNGRNVHLKPLDNTIKSIKIGEVITHSDGNGINHRGVIIDIKDDTAYLVICTTNPYWNKASRKATKNELDLFRFKLDSYIVPVKRPINQLYSIGYSFPKYRIENFKKEFFS